MEKLDKAYEAVDLLKSIDIPISPEQKAIISRLEKDYVREEIIPLFEQELQSMVGKMRNKFELEVTYSKENGVDISLVDRPKDSTADICKRTASKTTAKIHHTRIVS